MKHFGLGFSFQSRAARGLLCHAATRLALAFLLRPRGLPYLDRLVPASRSQLLTVRAKSHGANQTRVTLESQGFLAGLRVPNFDSVVRAGRGQPPPVGTERNAMNGASVSL